LRLQFDPRETGVIEKRGLKMAPKTWSLTKQAANYRPAPKPEVSCAACKWMFPRLPIGSCKYVRGIVEGSATCDEFQPRRPGRTTED
jgi:hypothetical protein